MQTNKAIFLDRDGTINVDSGYVYKKEDFIFQPGVVEALQAFNKMGFLLFVISNQSGIARGYYTEKEYLSLQTWMVSTLKKVEVDIKACYYCPHLKGAIIKEYDVDCECRKPKTGLFWKAKNEYNIDFQKSYAIGNMERDLSICQETKATGILFQSNEKTLYPCFDKWEEIVEYIKARENGRRNSCCTSL